MPVELIVDSQMGSQLIGTRGCVISELERESGAKINVDRDALGRNEKLVCVKGDNRDVQAAVELILNKLQDTGARSGEINIRIPPSSTTAIVGAGGATVKRLQEETGAHINLPRKGSGEQGRVHLTGSNNGILTSVIMAINSIVESDDRRGGGKDERRFETRDPPRRESFAPRDRDFGGSRNGGGVATGPTIEFLLGSSLARALVGKGGSVVSSIERQTGSNISISKGDDENRFVSIKNGDRVEALKICLEKLEDTINESISSVHFQVPEGSTRMIIGSQGATVHRIQKDAHARVDVAKEGGAGTVSISGTIRQIVKAAGMVYDVVDGADRRDNPAPRGGRDDFRDRAPPRREYEDRRRDDSPPPKRRREETGPALELVVSSRTAPKLVGPKGSVINDIIEQSGARVNIDKGGSQDKSVVISGDAESRAKALQLIMKILENDGPLKDLSLRIPVKQVTSVVGPKGATVMAIEEETGAKVHIARRNGNEERGAAQIVGSMDQIYDAVVKVDDIVNREE